MYANTGFFNTDVYPAFFRYGEAQKQTESVCRQPWNTPDTSQESKRGTLAASPVTPGTASRVQKAKWDTIVYSEWCRYHIQLVDRWRQ